MVPSDPDFVSSRAQTWRRRFVQPVAVNGDKSLVIHEDVDSEEPSFLESAATQVSVALEAVDGAMSQGLEAIFGKEDWFAAAKKSVEEGATTRPVRTSADGPLPPRDALRLLKEGNMRFVKGTNLGSCTNDQLRKQLAEQGLC
eukprot:g16885.t1